jgi:hypothetical protein
MPVPTPQLKESGRGALDEYLKKVDSDRRVPATFLGATNKDGEMYFGCAGDRVFGKPDEGKVTPDSGKSNAH